LSGANSGGSASDCFSLVNGGPLFRFWRRTGLTGDDLQLVRRRVLVAVLLTWVPLLCLSLYDGRAWGDGVVLSFLNDVETQVRLLVAVPLLLLAEVRMHRELPAIMQCFIDQELIAPAQRPRFRRALASAMRLRDSVVAELLLLVAVYVVGMLIIRRTQFMLDIETWYAVVDGDRRVLTPAGWWGALVAMPAVQFLCVRWFYRFFIWGRLLWQVSHIPMNLEPAHPDCSAGLHFVALFERSSRIVMVAFGALLAGMIANRILYAGAGLLDFKVEIVGMLALLLGMVFGPMFAFTTRMQEVKHRALEEYGRLGQRYAHDFSQKWFHGVSPPNGPLLGSADIQSLADLRNSFLVVKDMRWTPFDFTDVVTVAACVLVPLVPLLLTKYSLEEIIDRLLKTVF
jgi:hypothetical protein